MKALDDLEWQRVAEAVAARCVGPRGQSSELPIATTPEGARVALRETAEVVALLAEDEPLPLDGLRDVRPHLARLGRQGALDGPALRDLRVVLGAARRLRLFLGRRKDRLPAMNDACALDPTLDVLADEIDAAVDSDGTVHDSASPDLRKLRTETANLRARLVARLEQLIQAKADLLSDRFYTIREGRYVLPVRADAHERVQGLVHATSQSGATVFVEPRALIEQGNRLKMAQAQMEREEARILGLVSDLVRERLAALGAAVDALDHADLRNAGARLGRDLGGVVLDLLDLPAVSLKQARHPGLLLDGARVVPNDIELEAGRALVISGPNAGGKTVALKTLGLAALMMRAGLPVPAEEGGGIGFFDPVLTDVGDDQSIARNLSTFSAHVTNLADILRSAGRGSLVLLDELAGSTDPQEGAALACAVVDVLCRRGAAVAVTTHYEPLKALALSDDRLRNASVGFDVERLEPTFELVMDVPGASSALLVAARFGIPDEVIEVARRVLPEQAKNFDELVRKLEDQRRSLEIERAGVADERRLLSSARHDAERRAQAMRERERDQLSREGERLLDAVKRARSDVRGARKRLRRRSLEESEIREIDRSVDEAARTVAEVESRTAAEPEAPPTAEVTRPEELTVGTRVWVPRLRAEAEVVEPPVRGKVRVAAGVLKLSVGVDEIQRVTDELGEGGGKDATPARSEPEVRAPRPPSTDNTLDVRGLRVDEALGMLETFMDRLYGQSEPVGYVVHGIGTGALRDAVRERLRDDRSYVDRARPGQADEGGDRITVFYLR